MEKRIVAIYFTLIICFTGIITKIYLISTGEKYAEAANQQSRFTLEIDKTRGYIYDKKLEPLTNNTYSYKASVLPCPESAIALIDQAGFTDREFIAKKSENHTPYTVSVENDQIYSKGIDVFKVINRYSQNQLAPHIIGHLGSQNEGLMGAELCFDDYLKSYEGSIAVSYDTNAMGSAFVGTMPQISKNGYDDKHGVVLTLDSNIQRIVKRATTGKIQKGAVVIMDVNNGNILSSLSLPEFDPTDIEKDLQNPDRPFFNRAFAPTSVGSTFKIIAVACAMEKGISLSKSYDCKGFIEVNGTKYHCQNRLGHGILNMTEAMEKSCNPYFVNLVKEIGVHNIAHKATQMGFGQSYEIMPGYFTAQGKIPNFDELENVGEATNFSFGQGMLTASPLQIAQMVSVIANGGKSITPRLVEGFTNDGIKISQYTEIQTDIQIVEENAAKIVQKLMNAVVENGSGKKAKPVEGSAGGKTGSAQTGIYENNEEIVHAWFAGFYPMKSPKYAIVILSEGGDSGGDVCAPIFKEICDNLALE